MKISNEYLIKSDLAQICASNASSKKSVNMTRFRIPCIVNTNRGDSIETMIQ